MSRWTDWRDSVNPSRAGYIDAARNIGNAPGGPESFYRALQTNNWSSGGGTSGNSNVHTSWDDIMGGWGADTPGLRRVGRGVGLYFAGRGINGATGTNWASSAARGVGNLLSGGGVGGGGAGGIGGLMGMGGGGSGGGMDNSMIAPLPITDPYATNSQSSLQPLLLAMMMANQQRSDDEPDGPVISAGGLA